MKITGSIALALALVTSVVAEKTVTVQLANDQSGANANVKVPADGEKHPIDHLWAHTSVVKDGTVYATSAQLTNFEQDSVCTISQRHPHVKETLDARRTWVSLKGGAVVGLEHAFVECSS